MFEKEAEEWLNKWKFCNKCENKVDCISNFSYCKKVVLQSYLAGAEPREKRIAELEQENAELKAKLLQEREIYWSKGFSYSKYKLEEAKDIIRDYKIVVEGDHTTVCSVPEENRCINVLKLNEQAEQF